MASGKHSRLLLSTHKHDTLWPLGQEATIDGYVRRIEGTGGQRWVPNSNSEHLVPIAEKGAKIYSWATLELLRFVDFAALDPAIITPTIPVHHHRFFATASQDPLGSTVNRRSAIHVWVMNDIKAEGGAEPIRPAFDLGAITAKIEQTIGIVGNRLVFLDRDYWV